MCAAWLCATVTALKGDRSPWPEGLREVGGGRGHGCPGAWLASLWSGDGCTHCGRPSGGCGVMREVGSKQQRCRMQHAGGRGGHPRIWMMGPTQGGSPPMAGLGVLPQTSFSHAKTIWQIEPKLGQA